MAVSKPDFTRQFGSAKSDLTPISNANYLQGWDYVGSTPPTKNDFTYIQNLTDQRLIWLFENYNSGRLITPPKLITAASTYTPTAGTNKIIVEIVGGGGAGGGATAGSTTSNSAGGGGGGGAYARILITSVPSSVSCSPGGGGVGIAGATGPDGNVSSFGSFASCPGGLGGGVNTASNGAVITGGASATLMPTTSNSIVLVSTAGQPGTSGLMLNGQGGFGGNGGSGPFGSGSRGSSLGSGANGMGNGSGGSGALNLAQTSIARPGGNGAPGLIIVWEYT